MAERLTRIRPGSLLRQPGISSFDWSRAGVRPLIVSALSTALFLAITGGLAFVAAVIP
jgi:hypothetical protein